MNNKTELYKDAKLFNIILNELGRIVGTECNFICVSSPGSSPSKVYMFKDNQNHIYAVKLCNRNLSRVSLLKEAKNYEILVPYMKDHLPKIIYTGIIDNFEIMISESKGVDSLYSSIILNKNTTEYYLDIWSKVLVSIVNMWKETKEYNYDSEKNPRNNKERIKRIKDGVYKTLLSFLRDDDCIYYPIVVNGIEYISLNETFKIIRKVGPPKFGVTCHGDPQPSNIVVTDDKNWYLVDWEWSGKNHDFRIMFSHFFGWWATRMIRLKKSSGISIKSKKIVINYEISNYNEIDLFQQMAYKLVNKVLKISKNDSSDINRFLALLYLGDIRFLKIWEKCDYLPLLIGEAIKTANYVENKNIKNVDRMFTFMGDKNE